MKQASFLGEIFRCQHTSYSLLLVKQAYYSQDQDWTRWQYGIQESEEFHKK
jgi:hypothetical protein